MKSYLVAVTLTLCLAISGYSQPTVVVENDSIGGTLVCGYYLYGGEDPYTQYVAIVNPDSVQEAIQFSLAFSATTLEPLTNFQVEYYNGFDTLFGPLAAISFDAEQFLYIDSSTTIVTLRAETPTPESGYGLPISSDTVFYFGISFEVSDYHEPSDLLYVDSASSPAFGDWSFSAGSNPSFAHYAMWMFTGPLWDWYWAEIENPPETPLVATPCLPASYRFEAGPWGFTFKYELLSGPPGAEVDPNTGVFHWLPAPEYIGELVTASLRVLVDACGSWWEPYWIWDGMTYDFTIDVGDYANCSPPQFAPAQPTTFVVSTGEDLTVQFDVNDPDPYNQYTFSYFVSSEDPWPPCDFDTLTGAFHYTGTAADTNLYYVYTVVHDGPYADTTGFYLYHFDSYICGDMNHFGGIAVSDLTWLINFLFRGGPAPVTMLAGDVDCGGDIGIADLTYLIAHLFRGGPAPCASCP